MSSFRVHNEKKRVELISLSNIMLEDWTIIGPHKFAGSNLKSYKIMYTSNDLRDLFRNY